MKLANYKKLIVPATILIATFFLSKFITNNPPKNVRGGPVGLAKTSVKTLELSPQRYGVILESFGTVQPRTQSVLIAQVSGEINKINQQFSDGGFFEKGDVLVQLDDRDHRAEVKINESNLLSAKQVLLEEQARAEQALVDWKRLGNGKKPSSLVLREPQLATAKAQVLSAQAKLEKAQLSLERTKVVAPYAGRILAKHVDLGRVVVNNTQLADIYAIDYVEVRLPINNKDLIFMDLPEQYRYSGETQTSSKVTLSANLIGQQQWQGKIVRTEGAIDANSQQLYIVAQIDNPYNKININVAPIKIGQYVNAQIVGKTIEQALVIPNSAIYQGSYVYIVEQVNGNSVLKRKDIIIRWQNNQEAIIESGLVFGEKLVLTPLGQVSSGTPVNTISTTSKAMEKRPVNKRRTEKNKRLPKEKQLGKRPPKNVPEINKEANS